MKLKLTIIDILIIICIVCAVGFAVYHMTSDSDDGSAVSFDSSTTNKLAENYLNLYKEGYIIKSQIVGINASSGEKVSINGTVLWVGDEKGSDVKVLVESNGEKYLAGLYKDVPEADIYINQISLETTGEKYENVKEIKISPMTVSSLGDLISGLDNTQYELSTDIAVHEIDSITYQELANKLNEIKQPKITVTNSPSNLLKLNRVDNQTISIANSILGSINGQTNQITIKIYNCSDDDIKIIKENYDVVNVKNIT